MNTTAAAAQAGVSIDTIRAWCRTGIIAAIKQAGQWIIEATSLAHRIAIAKMRAPRTIRYQCRHLVRTRGQGPTIVDGPCPACYRIQRQRAAEVAARGPIATHAQVNYLAGLVAKTTALPTGCPTSREALAALPRRDASALIGQLKNATSRRPGRAPRCNCASAWYGGICTC